MCGRKSNKEGIHVKRIIYVAVAAALIGGLALLPGKASSHREAPLIAMDPMADNTDLYAFVSPDAPTTVTMIANYIPLEAPASGPNFPAFDDTVSYEIHVDNDGDGQEDLTYPNWNRPQTYDVTLVRASHGNSTRQEVLGTNLTTPPDNIGPRSTPNYDTLASAAIHSLPGDIQVFAGQRDDPFFVDLGSVFDLAGLRPFNPAHLIPLPAAAGRDAVARYNTHSIAIQVPIAQLVQAPRTNIGIYASASRQQVRILRNDGGSDDGGPFVQVSRLGEPLINEVVIPLGLKDRWNRTDPEDDGQFERLYTAPEVSRLENLLYGSALLPITVTGRADLVAILLTGVPNLNFTGPARADLLRLNTAIAPTASAGAGNRLGVLALPGPDLAG